MNWSQRLVEQRRGQQIGHSCTHSPLNQSMDFDERLSGLESTYGISR